MIYLSLPIIRICEVDSVLSFLYRKISGKSICLAICACFAVFFSVQNARAQSLGDPIVHITFGSGTSTYGPALAADSGYTDYHYTGQVSPDDGQYGIYNTTKGLNAGWVETSDHSGDPNGYMMVVNASFRTGLFYTRRIDGLCGSTSYQFSAWIKNILKGVGILPNVSFSIEALDGTVLSNFTTGNIPASDTWIQYPFTFTTPVSGQSVIVKMANYAAGGTGNDIAIDDITFSPYGTLISAQFDDNANKLACSGAPATFTIKTLTPLDSGYAQRLQRYTDGKWTNQSLPTTSSTFTFVTPDTPGHYSYRITKGDAANIEYSKCVVSSNELNVVVVPPPQIKFTVADTTCQGDTVVVINNTTVPGIVTVGWRWDFGDGQTSTEKNPKHFYASGGDYTITLTATMNLGCSSVLQKTIHIIPAIQADFDSAIFDCSNHSVSFTDKSIIPEGGAANRKWDFGDGTTRVGMDATPFQHFYDTAGTYKVRLTIITAKGCTATITKTINVFNAPQVNFILPEVCVSDAFAQFIDSTVVDHSTALSYLWNFGDDHATPGNLNISTDKNPKHRYTQAKQYLVTLKVITGDGCEATVSKTFTVNGANPHAEFTTLNPTALCSNKEVNFVNNSTVDFGNVTRLKWDFGDGSAPETDENPAPGKLYHHKFQTFGEPATKEYKVKLIAYSGASEASCESPTEQTITLLAGPQLMFSAPDSVCLNFGTVQFAAHETGGIAGTGVYTGRGVSSAGLFDPEKAGVGIFDISYTFTAISGCTETVAHTIKVNPLTQIDAGADVSIPDGDTTVLHPVSLAGDSLTYLWLPATGLNNNAIANPVVKIDKDMTYTLTVTNKYGCQVSDQVKVKILHDIIPPNTFTPNGDGVNDTWVIETLPPYTGCKVDIFNRNGQKVYTSIGYSTTGWDGRYNGANLPAGVYYYVINPRHRHQVISGFVTIIR